MSYYIGFQIKMIVKKEFRETIGYIINTKDWSKSENPIIHLINEEMDRTKVKMRIGDSAGSDYKFYDEAKGLLEFRQEWNENGRRNDVNRYLIYSIVPFIAEKIIEVRSYMEDEPEEYGVDGCKKKELEERIISLRNCKDENSLSEWFYY